MPYGRWFRTVWLRTGINNKILGRLVLVWSCSAPRNRQGSVPGLIHQVWFFVRFTGHIYPGRDRTAASRWQPRRRGRSCHPAPCDLLQSGAVPVLSQDRCPAASSQKQELRLKPWSPQQLMSTREKIKVANTWAIRVYYFSVFSGILRRF